MKKWHHLFIVWFGVQWMFNKHQVRVWICYKRKKASKKQVAFSKEIMRVTDTGSAHENQCLEKKAPESWRS